MEEIRVLTVEDDPMVAEIHRNFISALEGFRIVGVVDDGRKAIEFIRTGEVRLVLLDIYLPGMDGVETLKEIRSQGGNVDVIVVSAARSTAVVNTALQAGAFDYIVKPFVFERVKASLESFRQVVDTLRNGPEEIDQQRIDRLLSDRSAKRVVSSLPKGLNPRMVERVEGVLNESDSPLSSEEMAELLDVSRITARRYLEFMVASGRAVMERVYQHVGRPVNKYSMIR
ncbi:MAG: response regulator [Synergistales bacterium]|nr:response regulator [Synergistales bacterium]